MKKIASLFFCAFVALFAALMVFSFCNFSASAAEDESCNEYFYDDATGWWLTLIDSEEADYDTAVSSVGGLSTPNRDYDGMNDRFLVYLGFDECPKEARKGYFDSDPAGAKIVFPHGLWNVDSICDIYPAVENVCYTLQVGSDVLCSFEGPYSPEIGDDDGYVKLKFTKWRETTSLYLRYTSYFKFSYTSDPDTSYICSKTESSHDVEIFAVDMTAPVLDGSDGRYYINDDCTVTASDIATSYNKNPSGLYALYVKTPSDSHFTQYKGTTSYTVSKDGANGEYSFYAEDMCGNCSETVSIYLDTAPPVVAAEESEDSFTVTATDETGTAVLFDEYGNELGQSYTFLKDFLGTKSFYAVDAAGNASETLDVSISLVYPDGALLDCGDGSYVFVWDDPGGAAWLDGESYDNGTAIAEEGDHEIVFCPSQGESSSYAFAVTHFYVLTDSAEASCTKEGFETYVCSNCGDSYTVTYEKTEHRYAEYVSNATCERGAYVRYTCIYCGDSFEVETSSPSGHLYIPSSSGATCTTPGGTIYTCIYCGDSYAVGSGTLADHEYVTAEVVSATCEEYGYRTLVCANCGDERTDVIAPLGHDWYLSEESKDENGDIVRTYRCSRCSDFYEVNIGNTQNETAKALIGLFDSYSAYMWWILLACAGVWSLFMGIRYAMATRDEDRDKARRRIVNYVIGLVVIAVVLVAAPYLIYGIALLLS